MKQNKLDDLNLCLDDYFPKCDGTRTHPMKVSEILAIPEVKQAFKQELLRVLDGKKEELLGEGYGRVLKGTNKQYDQYLLGQIQALEDVKKAVSELI